MRVGSLFAGIGGLDLGLERAGMEIVWQVEIDEWCRRVLAKHWPDVKRYGDIRELRGDELEPVDLVIGGFPCQDISNAGRRAGITGTRSGLWREMVRTVRVVRPRFVLVENVAALLNRGMGTVLGDLAESGYDAEWDCLPACAFGAYHIRFRAFVVAYPKCEGLERQRIPRVFPAAHTWRPVQLPGLSESCVLRRRNGVSNYVERIRGLGNAVYVPQAEFIGRRIMEVSR